LDVNFVQKYRVYCGWFIDDEVVDEEVVDEEVVDEEVAEDM
jgi:hypothetical protein